MTGTIEISVQVLIKSMRTKLDDLRHAGMRAYRSPQLVADCEWMMTALDMLSSAVRCQTEPPQPIESEKLQGTKETAGGESASGKSRPSRKKAAAKSRLGTRPLSGEGK